jgi:hypothetical protein
MNLMEVQDIGGRIIAVVSVSVLGGVARIMLSNGEEKITAGRAFREIFVSGFAGLMVAFLFGDSQISTYLLGFLSGMAGLTAPFTLNYLSKVFKKYLAGGMTNGGSDDVKPRP